VLLWNLVIPFASGATVDPSKRAMLAHAAPPAWSKAPATYMAAECAIQFGRLRPANGRARRSL